ncbi:MAG: hypothetical protein JJ992_28145 [Planctomycetes bacterium]|nr:hypothetical protein [Planctomycetota bacterium]
MRRILAGNAPIFICSIFASAVCAGVLGDDGTGPDFTFHLPCAAAFAETEQWFLVEVAHDAPPGAVIAWRYSANRRTIARGESPVTAQPDGSLLSKFVVRTPSIRDGIVFETRLTASLIGGGEPNEVVQPVWVFPKDPLAGRRQSFVESRLLVLDREGDTAKRLNDLGIPFKRILGIEGLNGVEGGPLIIGDGTSFERYAAMGRSLNEFASNGGRVLCLAPADGALPFPEGDSESSLVQRLSFARKGVIAELDKRFDVDAFRSAPNHPCRFETQSNKGRVVLRTTSAEHGWPWIDIQYASGGRLLLCGFPLIRSWAHGPTPRYMFVRLLETMLAKPLPSKEN